MKTLWHYLKFWFAAMAAVAILTALISVAFFVFHNLTDDPNLTLWEICKYSFFSGILNGIVLGTIATLFLTGKYYWSVFKSALKRAFKKSKP